MKTIVFQSFRPTHVPAWMHRCMASVEGWAREQGYSYILLDDAFFDMVPDWFRLKSTVSRLPITDLARLQWMSKFLEGEWERVIWFDADVLIFNPEALRLESKGAEMVCHEVWIRTDKVGSMQAGTNASNCVMSFTRQSAFLNFYIESCIRIAREATESLPRNRLGPGFLRHIHRAANLELIRTIATFTPRMVREIAEGSRDCIRLHAQRWNGEIHGANLCSSLNAGENYDLRKREARMEKTIDLLLRTKGSIVNPGWWEVSISEPIEKRMDQVRNLLTRA